MSEIRLLPQHVAGLYNWFMEGTANPLHLYSRFESVTDYERLAVRREEGEIVFTIEKSTGRDADESVLVLKCSPEKQANVDWEY